MAEQPIRSAPAERYGSRKQQENMQQMRRLPQQQAASPARNQAGPSTSGGIAAPPPTGGPPARAPNPLIEMLSHPTEFPGEPIAQNAPDPHVLSVADMRFQLEEFIRNSPTVSRAMWDLHESVVREQYNSDRLGPRREMTRPSAQGLF